MTMTTLAAKHPNDTAPYTVAFSGDGIPGAATVTGHTVTGTGVTIVDHSVTGHVVTFIASGGKDGFTANVAISLTFSDGTVIARQFLIPVSSQI